MGLFTNPVVLDTNHTFSFRGQEFDKKAIVGIYVEPAAALAAESALTVKHDKSGAVTRHLLQRTIKRTPSADSTAGLKRITVNFTITADPLFSDTEVAEEVAIMKSALNAADVVKNMLLNLI